MVKLELNGLKFSIPSGLHDMTYSFWCEIHKEKNEIDKLVKLTKLSRDTIEKVEPFFSIQLAGLISDIVDYADIKDFANVNGLSTNKGFFQLNTPIEDKTIAQFVDFSLLLAKFRENERMFNLHKLTAIYVTHPYSYNAAEANASVIAMCTAAEVLAIGNRLIEEHINVVNKYKLHDEISDEIEAFSGFDDFYDKWGFYHVMVSLMDGNIMQFENFLKLRAGDVLLYLEYLADKSAVLKTYQDTLKKMSHVY